jgi:hypothetical protein
MSWDMWVMVFLLLFSWPPETSDQAAKYSKNQQGTDPSSETNNQRLIIVYP